MVEAENHLTKIIFKKGKAKMPKDEKILKKIGKLLTMYGVKDEEKEKFLADMQDAKYDDQDEIEEVAEQEEPKAEPVEEVDGKGKEVETEEPKTEETTEPTEEAPVDETPSEEPQAEEGNEVEEPQEVPPTEEPQEPIAEEQPVDNPATIDWQSKYEETQKALDGLKSKVDMLFDSLTKAGVLVNAPEQPNPEVGVEHNDPMGDGIASNKEGILAKLNK